MDPIVMASLSFLRNKAQNENNQMQQLQQPMQFQQPQVQFPTINSVFGR